MTAAGDDLALPPLMPWRLEDAAEMSPGDYLIGVLEKQWRGDEDSMEQALVVLLAATFRQAGLTADEATEKAIEYAAGGVHLTWNGSELGFEFQHAAASKADES